MAGVSLQPRDGYTLQVAVVSATATSTAAIAATASNFIRVYKMMLVAATATTVKFQDGTTDLTGLMTLGAGGGILLDLDGQPWFTCSVGAQFTVAQSGSSQLSGAIYYTLTPWAS